MKNVLYKYTFKPTKSSLDDESWWDNKVEYKSIVITVTDESNVVLITITETSSDGESDFEIDYCKEVHYKDECECGHQSKTNALTSAVLNGQKWIEEIVTGWLIKIEKSKEGRK